MLLENLVNIVTTLIKKNEEETVEIIDSFLNKFGFTKFQRDNSFRHFDELISAMKDVEMVRERYIYTCIKYDDTETTSNIMTSCVYCEKKINIVNGEHEILTVFQIVKQKGLALLKEIEAWRREHLLKKYLNYDFQINLERLLKRKEKLIPFIGSGLSVPFNLPNWKGMLESLGKHIKKGYEKFYFDLVNEGDFFEALSYLKKSSLLNDEDDEQLKYEIVDLFRESLTLDVAEKNHNYFDVIRLESDFYLTTNYDNIFSRLNNSEIPPLMWDEIHNMQKFLDVKKQAIIHLHGMMYKPKTMIVTKESYDKLYQDEEFFRTMYTFMSDKSLLFLGFSFSDIYFQDLYQKIISKISGEHFIILPNITFKQAQEFSKQNLKVIGINVETTQDGKLNGQDVVTGIKTILNYIIEN